MKKEYPGLNQINTDVLVEMSGMAAYPYFVRRMTAWGLSDGTYYRENPMKDNDEYILTEQHDGANVYLKRSR